MEDIEPNIIIYDCPKCYNGKLILESFDMYPPVIYERCPNCGYNQILKTEPPKSVEVVDTNVKVIE